MPVTRLPAAVRRPRGAAAGLNPWRAWPLRPRPQRSPPWLAREPAVKRQCLALPIRPGASLQTAPDGRTRPTKGTPDERTRPTGGDEGSPHGEAANGHAATAAAIGRGARPGRTGGPSAWCGLTERASDLPALPKAARGGTCRRPRPRRGAGPAFCQPSARSGGAQRWFGVGERRLAALSAYSG